MNGGVNWAWSFDRVTTVKKGKSKIMKITFKSKVKAGERQVEYRKSNEGDEVKWRNVKLPTMAERSAGKGLEAMA